MTKRTEKRASYVNYPKNIKSKEEKIEFLISDIKDNLLRIKTATKKNGGGMPPGLSGRLLEALMKETGKIGKEWVDYVNSEFDGISCWAEIKYVFSVKYPQDDIEPDVKKKGLKMFYEVTCSNSDPDYLFYFTHNGSGFFDRRMYEQEHQ